MNQHEEQGHGVEVDQGSGGFRARIKALVARLKPEGKGKGQLGMTKRQQRDFFDGRGED